MESTYSFRFSDEKLNRRLISLLQRHGVRHSVGKNGAVRYAPEDTELVENELIASIRDKVFSSWQIISCPKDCAEHYRNYITKHGVPYVEELIDDQLCFLIPRTYRPHSWKLGKAPYRKLSQYAG